jgi:DNA-binding IclR family transcriptional regulator
MKKEPDSKTSIQVIQRIVSLLDALSRHPDPASLKDLALEAKLHPSTAHRILNDLVQTRFIDRVEPSNYRLGMRLLDQETQQTINLSVRQGDEIVYIDRAFSERSGMQVVRAIGGRAPLHLTSTGKLFLSKDDNKLVRAYATRTGLNGHTKNSITDLLRLERELKWVQSHGYARDNEELEPGVRCMAAGILDDSGKLIAGLSISAPADRLQEEWQNSLIRTAEQISATLGYIKPNQN